MCLLKFARLWAILLIAILMIASIEGLILRHRGFEYHPKSVINGVQCRDLSIDAAGSWAVARVRLHQNDTAATNWCDVALIDLARHKAQLLNLRDVEPRCAVISPGGNTIAVAGNHGAIYLIQVPVGASEPSSTPDARLIVQEGDRAFTRLEFSRDGKLLVAIDGNDITVWSWPEGELISKNRHYGGLRQFVALTSDSFSIVAPAVSGGLCLLDSKTGEARETLDAIFGPFVEAATTADSQLVVVASLRHFGVCRLGIDRYIWDEACLSPVIAVDPSGERVAGLIFEEHAQRIVVLDVRDGSRQCQFDVGDSSITDIAFSTSRMLYSVDVAGHFRAWHEYDPDPLWSMSLLESIRDANNHSIDSD